MDKLAQSIIKKLFNYQPTMKKLTTLSIAICAIMLISVSCTKKCNLDEDDTSSGVVVSEHPATKGLVVIYPSAGYMTSSMGGDYLVNATDSYADEFEVSFDGGITKAPVNYGQYNILALPIDIECDAWVNRDVVIDDLNGLVTYTVTVHECGAGCDELRRLENYVLVPTFPANYNIIYNVN